MKRGGALVLFLAFLVAGAGTASMSELQKVMTLVKPAVVSIQTAFQARVVYSTASGSNVYGPYETGATGSGFIVNPDGFIVTNAHVVEASPDLIDQFLQHFVQSYVASIQQEAGREFSEGEIARLVGQIQSQGTITLVDDDGAAILKAEDIPRKVSVLTKAGLQQVKQGESAFPAEVRAVSPFDEKDVAILEIHGSNLPTVPLGDSDTVQLQDTVTVLGYPGAVQSTFELSGAFGADSQMEVTITQGIISSLKTWKDGSPILGTDAATTHGNSGGPAINSKGEVIGVLSMAALTPASQAFGFNFLRPINVVKDFIRASGVSPSSSLTDARYAEAMGHFWQGEELEDADKAGAARKEYQAALSGLQSVTDLYPQHPGAGRYIVRSEEALSRLPAGLGIPTWLVAVLVVVVVLGSLVVVLKRRSAGAGATAAASPSVAAAPQGRVWTLVGESGPLGGNRFPIGLEGVVIGRDPSQCQIVHQGETVSRQHARIQPGPDGIVLTNLSTTNKTYVNDEAISEARVRPGDRIRVGQVVFRIEA